MKSFCNDKFKVHMFRIKYGPMRIH